MKAVDQIADKIPLESSLEEVKNPRILDLIYLLYPATVELKQYRYNIPYACFIPTRPFYPSRSHTGICVLPALNSSV